MREIMTEIWYKLYSRSDPPCKYCKEAEDLLRVYGKNYYKIDINEVGIREMFKERGFKTVPQIFRESTHIGGRTDLQKHLQEEQKQKEITHGRT
jgi:glutaredoxin